MNVLTKVFVVVVAVLSILLVALVVPFVAGTEDYRDALKNSKAENEVLTATAKNSAEAMADALKSVDKSTKDAQVTQNQLQATIDDLNDKLSTSKIQLEQERTNSATIAAQLAALAAAEKQHADITEALSAELNQRRDELLREQKSRVDLAAANDRLENDLGSAKRQMARFQEQIALLDEKNADLEGQLAQVPAEVMSKITNPQSGDAGVAYEPPSPIKGQVTKVQQVEDATFVQINVGRADGVAKNMKFLVHRGKQFLGTLVITNVDDKVSAGTLQLGQGTQVVPGDAVLTGGVS